MAKGIKHAQYIAQMRVAAGSPSANSRINALNALITCRRSTGVGAANIAEIDKILLKLSVDKDISVRRELINQLVNVDKLSPDLVFSIAADIDEFSLPFISQTQALDARMITVIARVGDETRKAVLASRRDIPSAAVEIILREGSAKPIAALLENGHLKLTARQYEAIINAHGNVREIMDRLVRRRDLPSFLKVMMANRVSQEMRNGLPKDDQVAAEAAKRKIINAEEIGLLRIAGSTKPAELTHLVRYLIDRRQFTPSLLLRAACLGEMDVVVEALSVLSGMPTAKVRNLIYAKGALSLRAVHSKAALPDALFVPLRVAVDVETARLADKRPKSNEVFGRQMIEKVLTGYESLKAENRLDLLEILSVYGAPDAAALAIQLMAETDTRVAA